MLEIPKRRGYNRIKKAKHKFFLFFSTLEAYTMHKKGDANLL